MCIDIFVVEPGTIAGLPLAATNHAKLRCAPAGHVVASFLEFDHRRAAVASLPSLFLGDFDEFLRRRIFGTFA